MSNVSSGINTNNNNSVVVDLLSKLSSTVQNLQQNVTSLTGKVNNVTTQVHHLQTASTHRIAERTQLSSTDSPVADQTANCSSNTQFNLASAYRTLEQQMPTAAAGSEEQLNRNHNNHGYAIESLPTVETISPKLRQNIIQGRDINLASLLIPYYTGPCNEEQDEAFTTPCGAIKQPDSRLNRVLTLGEFVQAFSIYKNIMCSTYPQRREELDRYERDIIEMATRYPGSGFYEYHRQFSLRAASHLRFNNTAVNWAIRDNTLFCNIFANSRPNICNICYSTLHSTGFCPKQNGQMNFKGRPMSPNIPSPQSNIDIRGRNRIFHRGQEICNNYYGDRGCFSKRCNYIHVCLDCKGEHSRAVCQKNGAYTPNNGAKKQ